MQAQASASRTERQVDAAEKVAQVVSLARTDPSESVILRRVATSLGVQVSSLNQHDRQVIWQAYKAKWAEIESRPPSNSHSRRSPF